MSGTRWSDVVCAMGTSLGPSQCRISDGALEPLHPADSTMSSRDATRTDKSPANENASKLAFVRVSSSVRKE